MVFKTIEAEILEMKTKMSQTKELMEGRWAATDLMEETVTGNILEMEGKISQTIELMEERWAGTGKILV